MVPCLLAVPILLANFAWLCGFFEIRVQLGMAILLMLFGPPLVVGVVGPHLPASLVQVRFVICIGLYVISFVAFLSKPAAVEWTDGWVANIHRTKEPEGLQEWAKTILAKHADGSLQVVTNEHGSYVSIAKEEIPAVIQNYWPKPPQFTVADTREGLLANVTGLEGTETSHVCVNAHWYLHGLVVGPPAYRSNWKGWYDREVIPGIYAYYLLR